MAWHGMPITPTIATTHSFVKKVCLFNGYKLMAVCVSPALIQELKRIVQDSEIMKYELLLGSMTYGVGKMMPNGRNEIKMVVRNWKFVSEMNISRLKYVPSSPCFVLGGDRVLDRVDW